MVGIILLIQEERRKIMEERTLRTILLEFEKLNKHLTHMEEEHQNKFDLMDARFNTLEGIIVTIQNDIGSLQTKVSTLEIASQDMQHKMDNFESGLLDIQHTMGIFKSTLQDIQSKMIEFDTRLASLEKITLQMEYEFNDKISALFDAYSYHNDQYQKLEKRIRQNESKIANLSLSSC